MQRLPSKTKERAFNLRAKGYSITEIANKLSIAKSTSSVWLRDVKLNKNALKRLEKKELLSYYETSLRWKKKGLENKKKYDSLALGIINNIKKDPDHSKVYCSLLYWCEGGKTSDSYLIFTNSDPDLIQTFLNLLRRSFNIREDKFRILMHLHKYHNEEQQKVFWSKLTRISKDLFQKTYQKSNTGKRVKEGYQGCISLRYYDAKVAKEISSIYKNFSKYGGLV